MKVTINFYEFGNLKYAIFCRQSFDDSLRAFHEMFMRIIIGPGQSLQLTLSYARYAVISQSVLQIGFL